ncbi:MAG: RluA family pseudouridine synthase [Pseudomonadota bacterium]
MSGVQMVTLDAEADGQRLDRWFRKTYPQVTQGRIEKMCRKGEIRLDGARAKASDRLAEGQTLRVPPLPSAAPSIKPAATVSDADAEMIRGTVVYRDADVIVLNKPPGLAVQGGSGQGARHVDGLAPALAFDGAPPKLVHRLDKDTSGLLVLARTGRAAAQLAKAFQSRITRKMYWAAVAGVPAPKMGTIRFGLAKQAGHGPHGAGEKMVTLLPDEVRGTDGAKHAVSDYAVIEAAAKRTAWVALVPVTGRTHQLRAHMAGIGCPIVGDGKYGGNSTSNEGDGWGAQLGGDISRKLHLHARSLRLPHPSTGATLSLTAPLPEHMQRTWDMLGWSAQDAPADPFDTDEGWTP